VIELSLGPVSRGKLSMASFGLMSRQHFDGTGAAHHGVARLNAFAPVHPTDANRYLVGPRLNFDRRP